MRPCVGCGRDIADSVTVCPYCFVSQSSGESAVREPSPRPQPPPAPTPPPSAPPGVPVPASAPTSATPEWGPPPWQVPAPAPRKVPTYMLQAILCTALFCWPAGIVAIVYASRVNGRLAAGDYESALESSRRAKSWCWISAITGVFLWIVLLSSVGR